MIFGPAGARSQRSRVYRVVVPVRQATQPDGIGSLKSILGLLKSLKIRAQATEAGGIDSFESIPGLLES
jgi:hypothetical protein